MESLAVAASASVAASAGSLAGVRLAKASSANVSSVKMAPITCSAKEQDVDGESLQRRKVMAFAAAGVLAALVGTSGAAQAKPKPGSKEALKEFANICVSQPTASICHG